MLGRYAGLNISAGRVLAFLLAPAVLAHALILATWWGALRWLSGPVDPAVAIGVAWAVSLGLVWMVIRRDDFGAFESRILWLRLPAAALILGLLSAKAADGYMLTAYALAFVPPYLALMWRSYLTK